MRSLLTKSWVWKASSFVFGTLAVVSLGHGIFTRYADTMHEANTQLILRQHVQTTGGGLNINEDGRMTGFVRLVTERAVPVGDHVAIPMQAADADAAYLGVALVATGDSAPERALRDVTASAAERIVPVVGTLAETPDEAVTTAFPQIIGTAHLPVMNVGPGILADMATPRRGYDMWVTVLLSGLAILASLGAAIPSKRIALPVGHPARPRNAAQVKAMRRFDRVEPQEKLDQAHEAQHHKGAHRVSFRT